MDCLFTISEFFGGLVLLLGVGYLIGHLLKLSNYMEDYDPIHKI
jgi:hypothetical protein